MSAGWVQDRLDNQRLVRDCICAEADCHGALVEKFVSVAYGAAQGTGKWVVQCAANPAHRGIISRSDLLKSQQPALEAEQPLLLGLEEKRKRRAALYGEDE